MALQKLAPPPAKCDTEKDEDPSAKPLDLNDIQGDVLIGLQKDAEAFVFFSIQDVTGFKNVLQTTAALITSSEKVAFREKAIQLLKVSHSQTRLELLGLNIGFTRRGLERLLGDVDLGGTDGFDKAFIAGPRESAHDLGDELSRWRTPFGEDEDIDGVLLVTGPDCASTDAYAASIESRFGPALKVTGTVRGKTRSQRGHEHFGFLDGVSQPGILGLTEPQNPSDKGQGLPGQDLLAPGEFVLGYSDQTGIGPASGKSNPPLPWMENGSYMVFRRLDQRVLAFREFIKKDADARGLDRGLLAARMVGRWPSGAPVVISPLQDDPTLGADETRNNDFEYKRDDPFQRRCPYGAHIRKTYPRDDTNADGDDEGEADVQRHRLRRAGIPFGEEIGDEETVDQEAERGLLFVCYQTSIEDQFEFVQKSWSNNEDFVFGKHHPGQAQASPSVRPGYDPIIGQSAGMRRMDEPEPNYPLGSKRSSLTLPESFVIATGAGYFFMPPISAMRHGGALLQPYVVE